MSALCHCPTPRHPSTERWRFGYLVMGPILAECCHLLHAQLKRTEDADSSLVALYCARGGLTIRRALEEYCTQTGQRVPGLAHDFMVSRLAAARIALTTQPEEVAPLLGLEFADRDCRSVICALAGIDAPADAAWSQPYELSTFLALMRTTAIGRRAWDEIREQADLLREHFTRLIGTSQTIVLVDTGVFGSIGQYLSAGLPGSTIQTWMLFRANYKQREGLDQPPGIGIVCDWHRYSPWVLRSVFRLYWPLLESFFEPDLPSVRRYKRTAEADILSNLQTGDWRERLLPAPDTLRAGAYAYLRNLTAADVPRVRQRAADAWQRLRRAIVFPTRADVALLATAPRGLDFGFDETVTFQAPTVSNPLMRLLAARRSIWPEGAIRSGFPVTGTASLLAIEAWRAVRTVFDDLAAKLPAGASHEGR